VALDERDEGPELVGGLLVTVGGKTYDGTVRTRLAALRRRLAATGPGSSARAS
jgi:F0F1-type ATP synthase delta subunit